MRTATLTSPAHHARTDRPSDKPAHADPGPGLFLVAPFTLAATVIVLAWLSKATLGF